jgi:molecular chaperone GrpE
MSDATQAPRIKGLDSQSGRRTPEIDGARLPEETIEAALRDFRTWLTDYRSPTTEWPEPPPFDWGRLVEQITALRHEVNLQTKASRAATDAIANALVSVQTTSPVTSTVPEQNAGMVNMLLSIHDALYHSFSQAQALRVAPPEDVHKRPGFWARVFGAGAPSAVDDRLSKFAAAAADGYAISLRRMEEAFQTLKMMPIQTLGKPFDPETMEVVALATDGVPNTVVEEIRRGFFQDGRLLRCAQVRVVRAKSKDNNE